MEIKLTFTPEQLSVIDEGLKLVAYGKAAPVVNHINAQLKDIFEPKTEQVGE